MIEFCSELLETEEMGVKSAPPYLVTAGFGDYCLAHSC